MTKEYDYIRDEISRRESHINSFFGVDFGKDGTERTVIGKFKRNEKGEFEPMSEVTINSEKENHGSKDEMSRNYYNRGGISTLDIWKAYELGPVLATVVKYLLRAGKKPQETRLEDLKKARWYLNEEIKEEELKENTIEQQRQNNFQTGVKTQLNTISQREQRPLKDDPKS